MPETPLRKLAAIMFTDIVGYTAMMQEDESLAFQLRAKHRQVFENQHQQYHGEIIQYYGDGTLSIFNSAVEAVLCAIHIQRSLAEGNHLVPIRIGIHMGDIVYSKTEVYGDGVNTASRIESMGIPASILVSGAIHTEIKNHLEIRSTSLGSFEFKNISQPVTVHAITNQGLAVPRRTELKYSKGHPSMSVAVLPLNNLSSNPEHEYWCDGMTEEIINALVKVTGLKVTSRTSSFYFKGKKVTAKEIGEALHVSSFLQGSIRIIGHQIRLTIQLVEVEGDFVFWSEKFDRSIDDIFAVQDEVSLLIADRIREQFGHLEIADHLVEQENIPVEAYEAYLRSRYLMLQMGRSELVEGIEILLETIEKYPSYAKAHLGVHLGYTLQATLGFSPAMEAFAAGKPFLDRAIELDPDLPECQLNLAYVAFLQNWDTQSAYVHLNKALAIKPTVEYYQSMTSILVAEGKFDAALEYINHAHQLDPYSEINFHLRGFIFYAMGKHQSAIDSFQQSMELRPDSQLSLNYFGQALILLGQYEEALSFYANLPTPKNDVLRLAGTTLTKAASGQIAEAKAGISQLQDALKRDLNDQNFVKLIACHSWIGNHAAALELLEQGIQWRLPMMVYVGVEPILLPLRQTEKFRALIAQVITVTSDAEIGISKYKRPLLEPLQMEVLGKRLEETMASERPFLDPKLTLRKLAARIDVSPNQLSQLLNQKFDRNFAEFVNLHRLEVFKQLVADPENTHVTLLGLAYESGFNSKSVFNNFFKREMGQTPKAYWKSIQKK